MRVGSLISGLLLVLAGVVLFLINIGYGSWAVIYELIKWWPILLIIIGLSMFGKGKIPYWIAYLIVVLSIGAVAYHVVQMDNTADNKTITKSSVNISRQQYPDVKQCNLNVDYGAGKLSIAPGTLDLLKGDFNSKTAVKNVTASMDKLDVELRQSDDAWIPSDNKFNQWRLWISPDIAWILNINTGAVDGNIDLTGIPLQELDCNVGAGNMNFTLGNNGARSQIKIEAGASNITLQIPDDTGVSIKLDGALNSNNLDTLGWSRTDDNYYTSPNYSQAAAKIDCDIELSAGNLEVNTHPMETI
ncbi:MAG: DUF5668 domain-containing protein [Syntrophomonas sp.]